MKALKIQGRQTASGTVTVAGNKNACLPMIAAAVLSNEPIILHNVPDILDVRNMLKILVELGARVEFSEGTLTIDTVSLHGNAPSKELCHATRTSILFAGPIAARTGESHLFHPGGDVIGRRRIDTHFYGLAKLGIVHRDDDDSYHFHIPIGKGLTGSDMFLDEASVTATEHILTVAVLSKGTTIIRNAASEPHVSQLAQLLVKMGAQISGIETNTLTIHGVEKLHGAEFTVGADHIQAASFMSLTAATGGEIELLGEIMPHDYWMTRRVFERFGATFTVEPGRLHLRQGHPLAIINDADGVMPTISDGTWPQFPSDMMSCMIAMATQAKGTTLFFEKMFESRLYFVDRLIMMGANAVICDPHRVVISGPSQLHGAELISPDIRAGMALVIAACCARGTSLIRNADMIYRGYDRLPQNLRQLGIALDEIEM